MAGIVGARPDSAGRRFFFSVHSIEELDFFKGRGEQNAGAFHRPAGGGDDRSCDGRRRPQLDVEGALGFQFADGWGHVRQVAGRFDPDDARGDFVIEIGLKMSGCLPRACEKACPALTLSCSSVITFLRYGLGCCLAIASRPAHRSHPLASMVASWLVMISSSFCVTCWLVICW